MISPHYWYHLLCKAPLIAHLPRIPLLVQPIPGGYMGTFNVNRRGNPCSITVDPKAHTEPHHMPHTLLHELAHYAVHTCMPPHGMAWRHMYFKLVGWFTDTDPGNFEASRRRIISARAFRECDRNNGSLEDFITANAVFVAVNYPAKTNRFWSSRPQAPQPSVVAAAHRTNVDRRDD